MLKSCLFLLQNEVEIHIILVHQSSKCTNLWRAEYGSAGRDQKGRKTDEHNRLQGEGGRVWSPREIRAEIWAGRKAVAHQRESRRTHRRREIRPIGAGDLQDSDVPLLWLLRAHQELLLRHL